MYRILIDGEWYDRISSASLYENEFEKLLIDNARHFAPNYYVCPFKILVQSDEGGAKADLAFVDQHYRGWFVVEVELGHHSFAGHVLPQVRRLKSGVYGPDHALHMLGRNPSLNQQRLLDMVKGQQPKIVVLVNQYQPDWADDLARIDVQLFNFAIFKSDKEKYIFKTNMVISSISPSLISMCRRDPFIGTWLKVVSPGALPVLPDEPLTLYFAGGATVWARVDLAQNVYLMPRGRCPLGTAVEYQLVRRETGEYELVGCGTEGSV